MPKVQGVFSKQGTDLSPLLNAAAGENALALTALLRAESGLDERAWRFTKWPDCSAGLSQVIAPNVGFGTYQVPATDAELALYRAYMDQPENAIREGWRFFKPALDRMGGDPVLGMCAYNLGPGATPNAAALKALIAQGQQGSTDPPAVKAARAWTHYGQHWEAALAYAIPQEEPAMPADTETNARAYQWGLGAEAAAARWQLNKPFGPAVVDGRYQDVYPGLDEPARFGKTPGDILIVEQLVGVAGEDRPRGTLRYYDTGPGDGWDGWSFSPFG